jgi:peptidoglycan/xylan/chitin deacetylase (PgdA/CDA1 family)
MANHTYSHPYFSKLTIEQCLAEIHLTHIILEELHEQAGVVWNKRYFRFPFGDDGSGTDLWQRLRHKAPLVTPDRAEAVQDYLRQLGYAQPQFEGVTHPFFLDYCRNHVDVFLTYDAQDWQIAQDKTEDGQATINALLVRMDEYQPDAFVNLSDTDSGTVLCFHDMVHPQSVALFKQMVLKVLDKGFVFAWPP